MSAPSRFPKTVLGADGGATKLVDALPVPNEAVLGSAGLGCGVIGGVGAVSGGCFRPVTMPDPVAATPGRLVRLGVGLLVTTDGPVAGANEDIVATEDAEFVLVGLGGRKVGTDDAEGCVPDDGGLMSEASGAAGAVGVA